jgi:hypothetical protein
MSANTMIPEIIIPELQSQSYRVVLYFKSFMLIYVVFGSGAKIIIKLNIFNLILFKVNNFKQYQIKLIN